MDRMRGRLTLVTVGLAALVGVLVGLVLAGSLSPSRAHSSEPSQQAGSKAPPVLTAVPQTPDLDRPRPAPASFADLAARVNPAVVSVSASSVGEEANPRQGNRDTDDPLFRPPDRERRGPRRGAGTGFIVDPAGYLVTNHHVVDGADRITVRLASGHRLPAQAVGSDRETDIALLRIPADRRWPAVSLGDSDRLRVGDWVMAIGNPLAYEHTVTAGVVSYIGRKLFDGSLDRYVQTDAAINLGNSGGPLVNTSGEVVGIAAAVSSRAPAIGFAIPINQAKAILPQLRARGHVSRGYAGLAVRDLDPDLQTALGLGTTEGAVIQDVTPGSPAERAGLRPYDVIMAVDDRAITTGDELIALVSGRRPGEHVTVHLSRDGRASSVLVKLAERPRGEGAPSSSVAQRRVTSRVGLSVRALDAALESRLNLPSGLSGVVVWRVDAVGPAADADIERGDVILEINRKTAGSLADYDRLVGAAKSGEVLTVLVFKPTVSQRRLSTVRVD
jgi:serine protease Do